MVVGRHLGCAVIVHGPWGARASQLIAGVSRTRVGWSMQRQPNLAVLVLTATLCLALLSGMAARGDPVPPQIEFFVYYHNANRAVVGRQGVDVTRVGAGRTVALGSTDSNGEIEIKTNELFSPGNVALLFCDHKLPEVCTAIRLDSEFLKGFAEFNVQLPLAETIDRLKVTPTRTRE
jgi:hypothetical protein